MKEAAEYGRTHAFDPDFAEQLEEDCDNGGLDFEDDDEETDED
jgi:hypothetical protein